MLKLSFFEILELFLKKNFILFFFNQSNKVKALKGSSFQPVILILLSNLDWFFSADIFLLNLHVKVKIDDELNQRDLFYQCKHKNINDLTNHAQLNRGRFFDANKTMLLFFSSKNFLTILIFKKLVFQKI